MQNLKKNLLAYILSLLFSLTFIFWFIPNNMPEYPGYGMPASFLPYLATYFILGLSLCGLLATLFQYKRFKTTIENNDEKTEKVIKHRLSWKDYSFIIFTGISICFLFLIKTIGFLTSAPLFLLMLQLFCGQRKFIPLILISTLPVLITYLLMKFVLNVPIP